MRVVKDTEIEYRPFVSQTDYNADELVSLSAQSKEYTDEGDNTKSNVLKPLLAFEQEIEKTDSILETTEALNSILKEKLLIDDSQLFIYDKSCTKLKSIGLNDNNYFTSFVSHLNKQGSIDWIFNNDSSNKFSELMTYTVNGNNTKLVIIPIFQKNKRKGLLLLTFSSDIFSKSKNNFNLVQSLLKITLLKIESIMYKIQAAEVSKELQLYQSKISGDYRLLAIGELAIGVIEGILNPMQVIISSADMIADVNNNVDQNTVNIIKEQVNKVNKVISGLIRFAQRDKDDHTLQPVNLNKIIEDYHKVVVQSVRNKNYELILDLQNNIPSILSNRDYLYQLLTNIFAVLLSGKDGDGGVLVQTKISKNTVSLRVISTSYIKSFSAKNANENSDLSLNIIKKIMDKHEGNVQTFANRESGSTLILSFPLKRIE